MTKEGHRLWQTNQLRMPASTVLHGDLSGTSKVDWAIELAAAPGDRCNYLLIATKQGRAWKRLFLHESHGLTPIWNKSAPAGWLRCWAAEGIQLSGDDDLAEDGRRLHGWVFDRQTAGF